MAQVTTSQLYGTAVALGTNWTSTGNMYSSNDVRAAYANAGQNPIIVKTFDFSAIPAGAIITGIRILVEGNGASATASNRNIQVGITKDGTNLYGSYATAQNLNQTTDGTLTFGSQTSLDAFGANLTPPTLTEVQASTFGVIMRAGNTSTSARNIDGVQLEITYLTLAPYVRSKNKGVSSTSDASSFAIDMPASITAGDLLVVVFSVDEAPTVNIPSGWKRVGVQASNGSTVTGVVFTKVAVGGDTCTITTSSAQQASWASYSIANAGSIWGASANGSSTNSDPPNYDIGSAEDVLVLVTRSGDSTVVATVVPANFHDHQSQAAGGTSGASTNTAERTLNASALDPGTFTSSTEQWVTWTLFIKAPKLKVAKLSDDYNDNSNDSHKWTYYTADGGTISETNRRLEIVSGTAQYTETKVSSAVHVDFEESEASIELVDADGGADGGLNFTVTVLQGKLDDNNFFYIYINGGSYGLNVVENGNYTGVGGGTYDPDLHKFFKVRIASGYLTWYWSTDRKHWHEVDRYYLSWPASDLTLKYGTFPEGAGTTAAQTVIFDNFNAKNIFFDEFTEASDALLQNHTPDVGTSWTRLYSDTAGLDLVVNAAADNLRSEADTSDHGVIYTADGVYPTPDYAIEVKFTDDDDQTYYKWYWLLRVQDKDNLYAFVIFHGTNASKFYKKVGGSWTAIGSGLTMNTDFVNGDILKIEVVGTTLNFYVNNVLKITTTDTAITAAGKAGVATGGGSALIDSTDDASTVWQWDNFSVNAPTDVADGFDTLKEDFNAPDLNDVIWDYYEGEVGSSVVQAGGVVTLTPKPSGAGAVALINAQTSYNLLSRQAKVKAQQVLNADAHTETAMYLRMDENNFFRYGVFEGTQKIYAHKVIDGNYIEVAQATYNSSTMARWRIRESGGTVYFDYCSEANYLTDTWTNLGSCAIPFPVVDLVPELSAYADNVASPGAAIFDDFNVSEANSERSAKTHGKQYTRPFEIGVNIFSTSDNLGFPSYAADSVFDAKIDAMLAVGIRTIRLGTTTYTSTEALNHNKAAALRAIAKGMKVIFGVDAGGTDMTSTTWSDFETVVLDVAAWAQANGIYKFALGNEEELHIDNTTLTLSTLISNLKSLATSIQAIYTIGDVVYMTEPDYYDDWIAAGRGDIDAFGMNQYLGSNADGFNYTSFGNRLRKMVQAFGVDHLFVSEFSVSYVSLADFSTNEATQKAAIQKLIEQIIGSGVTQAFFFSFYDDEQPFGPAGYGAQKTDLSFRSLWDVLRPIDQERAAKVTGKLATSSERSAKLTGAAATTANDERAAIIHGKTTANSERAAKTTGKQLTTSERAAKVTGAGGTASNRDAKVTGKLESSDERAAKVKGQITVTSERAAKVHGTLNTASERAAKTRGKVDTTSQRSAKITGQTGTSSERAAKTSGKQGTSDSRFAKLRGFINTFGERLAKIFGKLNTTAERAAKIVGQLFTSSERGAKIHGKAETADERDAKLKGAFGADDERNAKIKGFANTNSERYATTRGFQIVTSERGAKITGKVTRTRPIILGPEVNIIDLPSKNSAADIKNNGPLDL